MARKPYRIPPAGYSKVNHSQIFSQFVLSDDSSIEVSLSALHFSKHCDLLVSLFVVFSGFICGQ